MPSWVIIFVFCGLLPFLIVALLTRKTMRVTLPVCDRHKNHWLVRRLFVGVFVAGSALAGLGGVMWALYRETLTAGIGSDVIVLVH